MNLIEKARKIATIAHNGQYRWDKVTPYISHPQAVSCAVSSDYEKAVAWLHDVLEDTKITEEHLRNEEIPEDVITAVKILTKNKDSDYLNYIIKVKRNDLARVVKIADINHNLSDLDYEKNKQRYEKYMLARFLLQLWIVL